MVKLGNNSFNPTKRQVNKRVGNTTGLKRKKINKLRKIEKRQRKKFNKTLTGTMPGEDRLDRMSMDKAESKMRSQIAKFTF